MTFLWRWRATALNPMRSNSPPSAAGSGAAYSTNSKPSVPIGLCEAITHFRPRKSRLNHRNVGRRNDRVALQRSNEHSGGASQSVGVVIKASGRAVIDDAVVRIMPGRGTGATPKPPVASSKVARQADGAIYRFV